MLITKIERNGNQVLRITTDVDESKPKCWIEGHEYKFNTEIVAVEVIETLKAPKYQAPPNRIEI